MKIILMNPNRNGINNNISKDIRNDTPIPNFYFCFQLPSNIGYSKGQVVPQDGIDMHPSGMTPSLVNFMGHLGSAYHKINGQMWDKK